MEEKQIMLLDTGELEKRVRLAKKAYRFGKGSEGALSRKAALTLRVYTC